MTIDAPRDDLFRGMDEAPALRAEGADGATGGSLMFGHFAVFDVWTEIHSWFEGDFLERFASGAFKKTVKDQRDTIKVQFDHGYDPHIGDALLGPVDDLREDDVGAYFEVPLLDTDYNRDRVLPMLQGRLMDGTQRGSLLGASFRFRVVRDSWDNEPGVSDHNPSGLPERTVYEVRLYEFGPVVFPAYPEATAGARSLTDHYIERRLAREGRAERAAQHLVPAAAGTGTAHTDAPASGHPSGSRSVRLDGLLSDITKLRRAS